ncbi:MAG TPA: hypothetical protein PLN85_01265 [archaeon]|jgi:hypothetical protein|nr:hypothetical protein [archaeon]
MIIDQKVNKQIVGVYLIDGNVNGTQMATTSKPNLVRKILTRLILGWKWVNVKKLKTLK